MKKIQELNEWFKKTTRDAHENSEKIPSTYEIDEAKKMIRRAINKAFTKQIEIDDSVIIEPHTLKSILKLVCTSITKSEIAEAMGINYAVLNSFIVNRTKTPSTESLYKMSVWVKQNIEKIKVKFNKHEPGGYSLFPNDHKNIQEFFKTWLQT